MAAVTACAPSRGGQVMDRRSRLKDHRAAMVKQAPAEFRLEAVGDTDKVLIKAARLQGEGAPHGQVASHDIGDRTSLDAGEVKLQIAAQSFTARPTVRGGR